MLSYIKTIVVAVLTFISVQAFYGQQCVKPKVTSEKGICAQMTVEFAELHRTSQLLGVVLDANGSPISDAVVEVYPAAGKGEVVATITTDEDGRFCIKDLERGRYRIKVGWSKFGFNCTEMQIEISGKTKRLVKVPLEVGN